MSVIALTLGVPAQGRDDEKHTPAISRRMRPRFASSFTLLEVEGAGKAGCALHPRSRVQNAYKKRTRAYRFSGGNPAFPARWFTAYFALSPVTGLFCHRRRRNHFHQLDTSVGVSGPHDFAVRLSAVRQ